jgi:FixJ family two-component response regulator
MAVSGINSNDPIVFVVDNDPGVRDALYALLTSLGRYVVTFGSAAEYLAYPRPDWPACLVLDVGLPDIQGLELQQQISGLGHPPIVFITGNGDISSAVRAIKAGAIDFLTKPLSRQDLLTAIDAAVAQDCAARCEKAEFTRLRDRLSCLTPREREVLPLVAGGYLNKQAAARLGISETTLQIHRSRVMRKMQAMSLAELVRIAGKLSVPLPPPGSQQA